MRENWSQLTGITYLLYEINFIALKELVSIMKEVKCCGVTSHITHLGLSPFLTFIFPLLIHSEELCCCLFQRCSDHFKGQRSKVKGPPQSILSSPYTPCATLHALHLKLLMPMVENTICSFGVVINHFFQV